MEDRSPSTFPLSNFIVFIVLSVVIMGGYSYWMTRQAAQQAAAKAAKEAEAPKPAPGKTAAPKGTPPKAKAATAKTAPPPAKPAAKEKPLAKGKPSPAEKPAPAEKAVPAVAAAPPRLPPQWFTLGSVDPHDPYRMLVTISNRGAALRGSSSSSDRYRDVEDRSGYLGHVVLEDDGAVGKGCPVQVVGAGTPAAKAGLQPGDLITALGDQPVRSYAALDVALSQTRPDQSVALAVLRRASR